MKHYDYIKARRFIDKNKDRIASAYLGMNEDWGWTVEPIYSDGKYYQDLRNPCLKIGGINGSAWATPTLEIDWKDDTITAYHCWTGESTGTDVYSVSHGDEFGELEEIED